MNLLSEKGFPEKLKKMSFDELEALCEEIREILISTVSKNGGHLASNLGVVELTVALHRVFSSPGDQIIFDVGHQAYTHKLLTGRYGKFQTLRREGGISGFPKPSESCHDVFATGHSSTSVSAACGFASAKNIKGEGGKVIAVIGDGAFTGGMVYEGLNNAGDYKNLIIALNDNEMSISKNVGGIARYLASTRTKRSYLQLKSYTKSFLSNIPFLGEKLIKRISSGASLLKEALYHSTLFEDLGFVYFGPVDGHDIKKCCEVFEAAKNFKNGPVFVHVTTVKGKGFVFAEQNPGAFHGVTKIDPDSPSAELPSEDSYSAAFGKKLTSLAESDSKICAVTAAMKYATGLNFFHDRFPKRFFDVGIAEEHAVTFSAGLAKAGLVPVFAVYSTFLQRAYDQIIHDAAVNKAHVVLAIDRAGLVGDDGETHQGLFDAAFLSAIPRVTVFSPFSYAELEDALERAVLGCKYIAAVRYPRGAEAKITNRAFIKNFTGGYSTDYNYYSAGANSLVCTYGREFAEVANAFRGQYDILKLCRISPVPEDCLKIALKYDRIYFYEEGIKKGGIGEHFIAALSEAGYAGEFRHIAVDFGLVGHASVKSSLKKLRLDAGSIFEDIGVPVNAK